ncbi:MAG: hypothetical protein ACRDQ5_19715 [Sciscionella sp.]
MAYQIEVYPKVREQILALPVGALAVLAEAMAMLELAPGNGEPLHNDIRLGLFAEQGYCAALGRALSALSADDVGWVSGV